MSNIDKFDSDSFIKTKFYGYKKDIFNVNDKSFSEIKPKLNQLGASNTNSEHTVLGNDQVEIFDQLSLNSCVANSTISALKILLANQRKFVNLSRLFCYWNARMLSQSTDTDNGCFLRDAYKSLSSLGVCLEDSWSYKIENVFATPPLESYKEGNDNIISSFYRLDSSGNQLLTDIELAVRANHPVSFGTAVSYEFERYQGEDRLWLPPTTNIAGLHAMLIIGIKTNSDGSTNYLIQNSWSKKWGKNGTCWFSGAYLIDENSSDFWCPTLIPDLLF